MTLLTAVLALAVIVLAGLCAWAGLRLRRKDSLTHMEEALAALPDCILILDVDERITFVNSAARCLMPSSSVTKTPLKQAFPQAAAALVKGESTFELEGRVFQIWRFDMKSDAGNTIVVIRNLTEKAAEINGLQQQLEQLEQQNASLDAFTQTVAHDLQAPLSLVVGYSDIMSQAKPDEITEEYRQIALRLKQAGLNMGDMVKNLLLLSHVEHAGKKVSQVAMNEVAQRAISRFSFELEQRGITVEVNTNMPDAKAHGPWVEEVYANLLSNAIKYIGRANENPNIKLTARHYGTHVRYEVIDNGIGIAPDNQAKLWEMFTRLDRTEAVGMGIGLSIVMRIVNKLNGEVGVESTLGEGSAFWFTLPAYIPQIVAA